jgi:epoxyqueuosine reductase
MSILNDLQSIASSRRLDYLGVASLAPARGFIADQGGDVVAGFPYAVSLGIALPNDIVDLLPRRAERAVQTACRSQAYDVINDRLNLVASEIASFLQQSGRRAFPVPAAERVDDERICASFSHKLAAHLAGLGWIGKSCLLVTPDHGPRVRWVTVLTDAPLDPTGKPMEQRCGKCTECVDICPVHAFTGRPFREDEPREARFDAAACDRYFKELEAGSGPVVCGLCLFVCPHGRKKKRRSPGKLQK